MTYFTTSPPSGPGQVLNQQGVDVSRLQVAGRADRSATDVEGSLHKQIVYNNQHK